MVDEETFHAIIEKKHDIIEFFRGKELVKHEFLVKGKFIDFVFKDSFYHYLVEMKFQRDPIEAFHDLDSKSPLFVSQTETPASRVKEVVLIDEETFERNKEKINFLKSKRDIEVITYSPDHLLSEFEKIQKEGVITREEMRIPEIEKVDAALDEFQKVKELIPLMQIVKYAQYTGYFSTHETLTTDEVAGLAMKLNCEGEKEEAIWLLFLLITTSNSNTALRIHQTWSWKRVNEDFDDFKKFFEQNKDNLPFESAEWRIGRWRFKKDFPETLRSYMEIMGGSQVRFFQEILNRTKNYYLAYDEAFRELIKVSFLGPHAAQIFLRFVDNYEIFPLKPYKNLHLTELEKRGLAMFSGKEFTHKEAEEKIRELCRLLDKSPFDIKNFLWELGPGYES